MVFNQLFFQRTCSFLNQSQNSSLVLGQFKFLQSENEGLAPMAIEKIKILGAVLELPAKPVSYTHLTLPTKRIV